MPSSSPPYGPTTVAPTSTPRSASSTSFTKPSLPGPWIQPRELDAICCTPTRTVQPVGARLLLGLADPADLGIGEGHPGQPVVAAEHVLALEQVRGEHARLPDRDVRELAVPGDVADRVEAVGDAACGRRRSSDRADGSRSTVSSPMSARLGLRPAATSSRDPVSTVPSSSVTSTPSPPAATRAGFERQCTAMPSRSNTVAHHLGRVRLLGVQQPVGRLDHGHLRAESRERLRELAPDRTAAHARERRRRRLGLDRLAVRPDEVGALAQLGQAVDRRQRRRRPGRDHDVPAAVGLAADHDAHPAVVVASGEPAGAARERRAGALEPLDGDAVVPVVGRLVADARVDGREVRLQLGVAGHALDAPRLGEQLGAAQHHLRRDAAVVRALAADQALVDAEHGPAGLRRPPRRRPRHPVRAPARSGRSRSWREPYGTMDT